MGRLPSPTRRRREKDRENEKRVRKRSRDCGGEGRDRERERRYRSGDRDNREHSQERSRRSSFPQKVADRSSPAYVVQGNIDGYVYLQQQHYTPPQQVVYQHSACHQVHPSHQQP